MESRIVKKITENFNRNICVTGIFYQNREKDIRKEIEIYYSVIIIVKKLIRNDIV